MMELMDRSPARLNLGREPSALDRLLRDVAAGRQEALADLYTRTSAKLYGICIRLLGSDSEAEEALQDVYLTIWRKAALFDPAQASPITWLAVLTRNKAVDRLRLRRAGSEPLEAAAEIPDDRPGADFLVQAAQDSDRLADCLGELEARDQGLIRAAFLDGASYPDLAELKSVPLGTMKSWIRRSLIRLRGCLER